MSEPVRVLIVEDDPVDADLMVRELKRGGFAPDWVRVQTESEYLAELEKEPEVILSDSNLPLFDGFEALDLMQKCGLDIPFILVSGRMGEDVAVDAMKRGAFDYLLKDRLARLGEAVRRALEERRLRAERTWAVGALRQSEERYRLVSEASSDYVYSLKVDPDGTLTCEWITEPFSRITGFGLADINSGGWECLCHPEDLAIAKQHLESLLAGQSGSIDLRIVTKEKRVRWIRVHERPVFDRDGKRVERIYGAAQDITVQKQLEEQLLQSRKMEAIGQLAGGVAHDFNNLLTVICGYGDLLKKLPDIGAAAHEYAGEILEAAKRAAQLTRQLLAFGRRQVMQSRTINLNGIVADIEKLLRRLIGEDVELRTSLDPALGLVKVDPGQIEQVIMNLAVNARDAMPRGGRLTIETANIAFDRNHPDQQAMPQGGPHVMLAVSDTGSGMDAETAARVFEPFFTTKELGKGTGLGLAMAYGIVNQSGGDIRVYTELGKGTTFKIYLPRLEKAVEAVAEPAPFNLLAMRGTETILVLEDEKALRSLIRQVLRGAGHTVLDTGDPDEAIQLCERHPGDIALLITDMVLPKLSGPQVAERVVKMRPGVRVIYTSGYPGKASIPNRLRRNGTAFFEKPFTPDTLVRKVRAVLDAEAG
jgi:two-component system, cell cycle sensor histidine kinase and response regulator CckA